MKIESMADAYREFEKCQKQLAMLGEMREKLRDFARSAQLLRPEFNHFEERVKEMNRMGEELSSDLIEVYRAFDFIKAMSKLKTDF